MLLPKCKIPPSGFNSHIYNKEFLNLKKRIYLRVIFFEKNFSKKIHTHAFKKCVFSHFFAFNAVKYDKTALLKPLTSSNAYNFIF